MFREKAGFPVVVEMEFASKVEAVEWVIQNQLARRNLTANQKEDLIGSLYNKRKRAVGSNQYTVDTGESLRQVDGTSETAETVAQKVQVSPRTVERAGVFAKAIDRIEEKAGQPVVVEILRRPEKTFFSSTTSNL
jgi:hypothetical protein